MTSLPARPTVPPTRQRDLRLDFFRGLGMFIILIAHITDNPWTLYIPARFGFSDATEIFVFCSGMASALAFGALFGRAGFLMGTMRILHRIWQVYWVHLGVFFVALFAMLVINASGLFPRDEVGALNLYPFLNNTKGNLLGLLTLTYVPNYFDILPMYLVILAMIPPVMALSRIDTRLPVLASLVLWGAAQVYGWNLPAELWFTNGSQRGWFFNPFTWQLIFFAGFSFMLGWLPAPPVNRALIGLAAAVVILSVPFAWHEVIGRSDWVRGWRQDWAFLFNKTTFGPLRFVHFLALAYLAWIAAGPRGAHLAGGGLRARLVGRIARVGQQSLAVFAASMVLARILGAFLTALGTTAAATLLINILGILLIVAVAEIAAFFKSQPWKEPKPTVRPDITGNAKQPVPANAMVKP